jgi:hypothetical protein
MKGPTHAGSGRVTHEVVYRVLMPDGTPSAECRAGCYGPDDAGRAVADRLAGRGLWAGVEFVGPITIEGVKP